MALKFFRGRGTTYLAERDANGIIGPALPICQDAISIALSTQSGTHTSKCGPFDAEDDRFTKSISGTVTLKYSDVANKKLAIAVLGKVVAAEGSPVAVANELLPAGLVDGDIYFAGGLKRHRNLTAVALTDSSTAPISLVLNTDYEIDVVTGKITFLDVSGHTQPYQLDYSHQDPASVSFMSASQKAYFLSFEAINTRDANEIGSLEAYNIRFDPAKLLDFLSDDLQELDLTGSMLVDLSKPITDTDFGQLGRRVGF